MEKGIWKKYERTNKLNEASRTSAQQLFIDTRNCGKDWYFVDNYSGCRLIIEGSVDGEYRSGDLYVYYKDDGNGNFLPEFYIKVMKYNINSNEINVQFNGQYNLDWAKINEEDLPVLINKLNEIDATMLNRSIAEVEDRYKCYQTIVELKNKENYTESELLFLYEMAYFKKMIPLARQIVKDRNVQKDYDSFTIDGKVNLFLYIKDGEISKQLRITEKDVITKLAQNTVLSMLNNATEEILNDKEYIMSLLVDYSESSKIISSEFDIEKYLPIKYQTDLDVLKLIFSEHCNSGYALEKWKKINKDLEQKLGDSYFAYQLVDAAAKSWIDLGSCYDDLFLLPLLSNEILNDIENHVLIGPEANDARENLKEESRKVIVKQKQCILNTRKKGC